MICCLLCAAHWYLLRKLHCFFVTIDEHESVIIIGLKINYFFCEFEKVQIGRFLAAMQFLTKCP